VVSPIIGPVVGPTLHPLKSTCILTGVLVSDLTGNTLITEAITGGINVTDTSVTSSLFPSNTLGTGLSSPSLFFSRVVTNLGPHLSQYIASSLNCETNSPFSPPLMIIVVRATISLK